MERLIVILPAAGGGIRWRRVDADGGAIASGVLIADARFEGDVPPATAIVPGSAVAVHWIDLAKASQAQAAAAARLMAAEIVAGPVADQHVAAAPVADGEGMRAIGIVARARMDDWIGQLLRHGIDPDIIVPAPLLLPELAEGVAVMRSGDAMLVRGERMAVEVEPELAEMLLGDRPRTTVTRDLFDLAAAMQPDAVPLNLRQGDYRAIRKSRIEHGRMRRLALLAAACVVALVATPVAKAVRHTLGANAAEAAIAAEARRVLGPQPVADPMGEIAARLAQKGAGGGFTAMAASLLSALEASGSIRIESLRYTAVGGIRATLVAPVGASLEPVRARLAASGLNLVEGASRGSDTGQRIDVEVTAS